MNDKLKAMFDSGNLDMIRLAYSLAEVENINLSDIISINDYLGRIEGSSLWHLLLPFKLLDNYFIGLWAGGHCYSTPSINHDNKHMYEAFEVMLYRYGKDGSFSFEEIFDKIDDKYKFRFDSIHRKLTNMTQSEIFDLVLNTV